VTSSKQYHELPDGTLMPRVTSVLDAISKPRLIPWAARKERELVVRVAAETAGHWPAGKPLGDGAFHDALLRSLGSPAHELLLEQAGDIGSAVHARIEWSPRQELGQHVETRPPLDRLEAIHGYRVFKAWRKSVELVPIHIEDRVWSRRHGYSGTMDLYCQMTLPGVGRVPVLLDWKTSKRIYGEAAIQNAAYLEALVEMGHAKHPSWGVVLRIPKDTAHAECEMKVYGPETQAARFAVFLAAFEVWRWQQEQEKNFKPVALPEPARPPQPVGDAFAFA
jgi:hypothetical protein